MGKFKQDLEIGKAGEDKARTILLASTRTISVIDCSDDIYFQNLDIDFLVERDDGTVVKYEVKTDRKAHETGNIVWETSTSGNIGCFEKSHADWFFYYILKTEEMYLFKAIRMRMYIERNKQNLRKVRMGDSAEGYLLNIAELRRAGVLVRV